MIAPRWAAAAVLLALAGCSENRTDQFQGWIEADLVFVGPDEAGRLETLSVNEGDAVAAETVLFTLDSDLQLADVRAAEATAAEARAKLARVEAAQQRPEEVAVLEAQERRIVAALQLSTAEFERQKALTDRNVGSAAQLDAARAAFERDRAQLEEIRHQIKVAQMAARTEDINAARQVLQAAEARLAAARTRLDRRTVTSPVSGSVEQVYFRPGEQVPAAKPILALLPPGNLKVRFFVGEAVLPQIARGTRVAVTCDGCGDGLTAQVDFIARSAEYTPPVIYSLEERGKLVYLVEARPDQPEKLRVGQPVSVALAAQEARP
jgi:HlyD family secretion protein